MPDADVVIVGAGVVGCATARELAPDHDVVVLDKGQPASGAAGHAAGIVADWWYFIGKHAFPGASKHA